MGGDWEECDAMRFSANVRGAISGAVPLSVQ